jgi:hypothetical protein
VVYGAWTNANRSRAEEIAEERLEETIALTLLLEDDLDARELFSGRGDAHRPGVRGLVIDRGAIGSLKEAEGDLVAHVVIHGPMGLAVSAGWWGDNPYPLALLLMQAHRRDTIDRIVTTDSSVGRRLAIAASWYAKSHWSRRAEDAVLALGIAFDGLLGDRAGLPGRVLADRFALLEPDPVRRAERAKRFGDLYSARSAIAHGGRSSALDEKHYSRAMARDVRWAASRVLTLVQAFDIRSEEGYRALFEDLKWGTKMHPDRAPRG